MLSSPIGLSLDLSSRVLALPLRMIDAEPDMLGGGNGLPAGCLDLTPANLILAATPCDAPLFEQAIANACTRFDRDILLVRTGLFPETLNPVTSQVALRTRGEPLLLDRLTFMRGRDGDLWLVPEGTGVFVEVRHDGLALETTPPFVTWDERCDGVCRAASEIVRLCARRRY